MDGFVNTDIANLLGPYTDADVNTFDTPAPAGKRGRRRRALLASALVVTGLVSGSAVGGAAPAHAATGYGTLIGCFESSVTLYGQTFWSPYAGEAYVDYWYDGDWYPWTTAGLSLATGCTRVQVPAGYYWRLRVDEYIKPMRYVGPSSQFTQPVISGATYHLGISRILTLNVG